MITFDDIEISWVISANYNSSDGKINLTCLALGNTEYEEYGEVVSSFSRSVNYKGETVAFPPVNIKYNTGDRVYVTGSPDDYGTVQFGVDDKLIITSNGQSIVKTFYEDCKSGIIPKDPFDISSILIEGNNTIYFKVADDCGKTIGSDPIYLVKYGGNDPREEISIWESYMVEEHSSITTLNSQRLLQSSGGSAYKLSDGFQSWNAILTDVKYSEDSFSNKAIVYELEFYIGNAVFKDEYGKCYEPDTSYPNINYAENISNNPQYTNKIKQYIGELNIVEPLPIKNIDIYGGAIKLPSWIEVNGERKYWHYIADEETEKMSWKLKDTYEVRIKSPNYSLKPDSMGFYGSKIKAVCLDIIPNTMGIPLKPPTDPAKPTKPQNQSIPKERYYYSPYTRYSNMNYYRWTTMDSYVPPKYRNVLGAVDGRELGIIIINEPYKVKEVRLWGNGCIKPASISVNGSWKQWKYYHDSKPKGSEILRFPITPTKKITIKTTVHKICPGNWDACNHGCNLGHIHIIYDR